ncbi:hypothetical protein GCM10010321_55750 [Streptomyces chartreusis]|nr:hypothetical protein GCM10010321_55750 [Streptomyces chartreusis]
MPAEGADPGFDKRRARAAHHPFHPHADEVRSCRERRAAHPGAASAPVHHGPGEARRQPQRTVLARPGKGTRGTRDTWVTAVGVDRRKDSPVHSREASVVHVVEVAHVDSLFTPTEPELRQYWATSH